MFTSSPVAVFSWAALTSTPRRQSCVICRVTSTVEACHQGSGPGARSHIVFEGVYIVAVWFLSVSNLGRAKPASQAHKIAAVSRFSSLCFSLIPELEQYTDVPRLLTCSKCHFSCLWMWVILLLMFFCKFFYQPLSSQCHLLLWSQLLFPSLKPALLYINWSTVLSDRLGEIGGPGQGWIANLELWRTRYSLTFIMKPPLSDLRCHYTEVKNKVFQTIILQAHVNRGYSWLRSCRWL